MSSYDKSLFIVTTHYTELSELEKESNGKIKNYKFEVDRDTSNNILFNYKLKRGHSNQYIALELLDKNEFDKDIIEKAIEVSKKIEINNIKQNVVEKEKKKNVKKNVKKNEKKNEK